MKILALTMLIRILKYQHDQRNLKGCFKQTSVSSLGQSY